jgi:hypothetical protein
MEPTVIFLLGVSFAIACTFAPDVLPLWARIAGFWIASALIILAGGLWLWPKLPLWLTPRMRLMPMREAATRAYERTLHSPVAETFRRASVPDELLVDYANLIRDTGIPLYGRRPPSRRFEVIPKEQYHRLQFTKDATGLKPIGPLDPVIYTEVAIGRYDLGRAIREIERQAQAQIG